MEDLSPDTTAVQIIDFSAELEGKKSIQDEFKLSPFSCTNERKGVLWGTCITITAAGQRMLLPQPTAHCTEAHLSLTEHMLASLSSP